MTLSDEVLELSPGEYIFLGPGLRLQNCRVVSKAPARDLCLPGLEMTGGAYEQKVRLRNFQFQRAHFSKVKFTGDFLGCDWGDWDNPDLSSVSECDFSEAKLHACRFLNTDMQQVLLPKWPHFCLLSPANARGVVLATAWPKDLSITLDVYTDVDPECVAVVADAAILAKQADVSIDDLRSMLNKIPGFVARD